MYSKISARLATRSSLTALLGLVIATAACDSRDAAPPAGEQPAMEGMGGMEGMPGMEGMAQPGSMQRHANELDEMAARMLQHIEQMRQLSADAQHERMGEHVTQVSQMLSIMNRQMREMDMGMGMSDEQMGRMMGMTGEEHRRMMEEMAALRAEVEQLQTASRAEVPGRMPPHLERLERAVQMLESSAAAMRGM